jgi:predicted nucleic acid-binding protein
MIIVSDTSPLNGLAITGYLWLLKQLYGRVLIPSAVADELRRGCEEDPRLTTVLSLDWISVCQPSDRLLVQTLQAERNLARGESEAIALGLELNAEELLIDERLGRREAIRLGLSITGLLGILLVAKRRELVTAIKPIMDDLISQASFRVSDRLYAEVLAAAGENIEEVID